MSDYPSFVQIALEKGLLSAAQIDECLENQKTVQKSTGLDIPLEQIFVSKKYLTQTQIKALLQASGAVKSPIEGYEIIRKLGEGGMGAVYLAKQKSTERKCALKVLPPKIAKQNPEAAERFIREAQAVAKLQHPNIVAGYDVGKSGELHYFAMEFVDGQSLAELIENSGVLMEEHAIKLFIEITKGLEAAAKKGMVHRDIKPHNILITKDGVPKIADFGLAKVEGQNTLTQTGMGMGTPAYISPEQARGEKKLDSRADIYSLGCTLFHALCGVPPFTDDNPLLVLKAHCEKPISEPKRINASLSDGIVMILKKMCAKKADMRFQSCGDLLKALSNLQGGTGVQIEADLNKTVSAKSPSVTEKVERQPTRRNHQDKNEDDSDRRSRRQSEKKSPVPLIAGIAGGAVLLIVILIFALSGGEKNPELAKKTPATGGPESKIATPKEAEEEALPVKTATPKKDKDTAKPEFDLKEVRGAVEKIVKGCADSPAGYKTAKDKLVALKEKYDVGDAQDIIEKAAVEMDGKRSKLASKKFDDLKEEADKLLAEDKYTDAIKKLESFPSGDFQDTDATKKLDELITTVKTKAQEKIDGIAKEVDELVDKGDFKSVESKLEDLKAIDFETAQEKFKELSTGLADKQKVYEEEIAASALLSECAKLATAKNWEKLEERLSALNDKYAETNTVKNAAKQIEKFKETMTKGQEGTLPTKVPDWAKNILSKEQITGAQKAKVSPAIEVDLGKGVKLKMVFIPPGEFMMGSPDTEKDRQPMDGPQHKVKISKGFYIGVYEITQAQYEVIMANNPSRFKDPNKPVEASWKDANQFVFGINEKLKAGDKYRLPSEAEWEYACRSGTGTRFHYGDDNDYKLLDIYAWCSNEKKHNENVLYSAFCENHPVGEKKPNKWGLYDMHGNVWEWCADWYGSYGSTSQTDPTGPSSGTHRVLRGGSCSYIGLDVPGSTLRSARRGYDYPHSRDIGNHGFRVVRSN